MHTVASFYATVVVALDSLPPLMSQAACTNEPPLHARSHTCNCFITHAHAHTIPATQAAQCFVLDLDQRAFLAAVKDRIASGLGPVPATSALDPAADTSSRTSSGPIVVDPATYFGSSTSNGFSNSSWPVGQHVRDFFWGELTLSEGAPFECLTPDGKSTVSVVDGWLLECWGGAEVVWCGFSGGGQTRRHALLQQTNSPLCLFVWLPVCALQVSKRLPRCTCITPMHTHTHTHTFTHNHT